MKKTILPALAVMAMMVSCGPSAEETAAKVQHMKDSIDMVEKETRQQLEDRMKAIQDSTTEAAKAANEKLEAEVDAVKDNMEKNADANKKELDRIKAEANKKAKDEKKKEDATVKPGQGRG